MAALGQFLQQVLTDEASSAGEGKQHAGAFFIRQRSCHETECAFAGILTGFGEVNHTNHKWFIDLVSVTPDSTVSATYTPTGAKGDSGDERGYTRRWRQSEAAANVAPTRKARLQTGTPRQGRREPVTRGRRFCRHGQGCPTARWSLKWKQLLRVFEQKIAKNCDMERPWCVNRRQARLDTAFAGGISNSGTIIGAAYGIVVSAVSAFAGGVTNSGRISAGGQSGAIFVNNVSNFSGGIVNAASGLISALTSGIGATGVSTFAGGIANKGAIAAATTGIFVSGGSTFLGGISNSGRIVATNRDGINATSITLFGNGSAGGGISNAGTISAKSEGINLLNVSTFKGVVGNSGKIVATTGHGINVGNVGLFGNTSGVGITNSGTISASASAIKAFNIATFLQGIGNSGTIFSSNHTGILVNDVTGFTGGISNKGRIAVAQDGILVGHSISSPSVLLLSFGGGISNSGTISAGRTGVFVGGVAKNGDSVTLEMFSSGIRNSGTISGGVGRGILVGGIATGTGTSVTLATVAGGVTNSGRIMAGSNEPAIMIGALAPGGLSSEASVTIETFSGGVRNTSAILAAGNAILVGGEGTIGGAVTISSFSGGITNAGPISAGRNGIVVGADSDASVTIATFAGGVGNTGVITAAIEGIVVGRSSLRPLSYRPSPAASATAARLRRYLPASSSVPSSVSAMASRIPARS
jgi:hypothetical protein